MADDWEQELFEESEVISPPLAFPKMQPPMARRSQHREMSWAKVMNLHVKEANAKEVLEINKVHFMNWEKKHVRQVDRKHRRLAKAQFPSLAGCQPHVLPEDLRVLDVMSASKGRTVLSVVHIHQRKMYALKVYHKVHQKNLDFIRLKKETMETVRDSLYLVHLETYFETARSFCFLIEYCAGGDIYQLHSERSLGLLSLKNAPSTTAQVVLALHQLHAVAKVMHRDVKPANLLLLPSGHVKLGDFGFVEKADGSREPCGSEGFASPEVLCAAPYDFTTDLFSLGCMLHWFLLGKLPMFQTRSDNAVAMLLGDTVKDIIPDSLELPDSLLGTHAGDLLRTLLSWDPKKRGFHETTVEGIYLSLKAHPFFETVHWDQVMRGKLENNPLLAHCKARSRKVFKSVGSLWRDTAR